MTFLRSTLMKGAFAAALATGALVSSVASADVACNRWGECWHVNDRFAYPAGVGITFHADDWGRYHHRGYHWRHDRFDRGYYRNGVWIAF